MPIILENEMSLEGLKQLLVEFGYSVRIVEVLPATSELERDAHLQISLPDDVSIVLFKCMHSDLLLKFRVILKDINQLGELSENYEREILDGAASLNQNNDCFGTLSTTNILGITIEYSLPYKDCLQEETILNVIDKLREGVVVANKYLEDYF